MRPPQQNTETTDKPVESVQNEFQNLYLSGANAVIKGA